MRIALGVEYNGYGFFGWQAQRNLATIQGTLQEALAKVANESVFLFCAGRTDANVHATGQVVHFDTHAKRHIDAWIWGTNAHLPPSIVVRWARQTDYSFHARFTAVARRYRYVIFNHPIRSAVLSSRATWHYYPLDAERMREAGKYLIGEQDFSSFRSSQCNSKSPMRCVTEFSIERRGDFIIFDIEANAFLHHMVRNIAGVLMKIGAGIQQPGWMQEVLQAKNRRAAAETAPPDGLYLTRVRYPEPYIFPLSHEPFLL
ncbi:tRNA pseudouridine(38-40) synthase TruA [Aquicella lusitana]|uniref:tRNA pseudouridine synthase A n=1 Tax=Aquicella lusitana TaxID=254246 RepID=A0A370GQS9_9COXI|nr:tRNA pseudouridine(38-40) synthase TruA [Aquicella lusitana]RDI46072.1 tRNA pseudouridine38-40 synthase [Aquicella lusitana]VVC73331.1 tRNA pseudouridine synthase A [Aquicella lusitana]